MQKKEVQAIVTRDCLLPTSTSATPAGCHVQAWAWVTWLCLLCMPFPFPVAGTMAAQPQLYRQTQGLMAGIGVPLTL